jgi:hypothetical protein
MPSRVTMTLRANRRRWLALLCVLGVCGVGAYAVYATSRPGEPTQRYPTRYASTGRSFAAGGLGSFRIWARIVGGALYPAAAPHAIRLTVVNPSDVSMFVTRLTVTVHGGPAGCAAASNIRLVQSNVSSATALTIRAHGTVSLPGQGRWAPTIQLRDRLVNQDACQNARFSLRVTGSAHS